jgi:hypothetical protein
MVALDAVEIELDGGQTSQSVVLPVVELGDVFEGDVGEMGGHQLAKSVQRGFLVRHTEYGEVSGDEFRGECQIGHRYPLREIVKAGQRNVESWVDAELLPDAKPSESAVRHPTFRKTRNVGHPRFINCRQMCSLTTDSRQLRAVFPHSLPERSLP